MLSKRISINQGCDTLAPLKRDHREEADGEGEWKLFPLHSLQSEKPVANEAGGFALMRWMNPKDNLSQVIMHRCEMRGRMLKNIMIKISF